MGQVICFVWAADMGMWENETRATFIYGVTSIGQPIADTDQLKVFPNPFNNVVSIENTSLKEFDIQIYNANGQLVKYISKGQSHQEINLASLKNGIYMLKITTPESQKVVKLLKQN